MVQLEIACFSAASAVIAQQSGAHRIELCADRAVGGITPSLDVFTQVKTQADLPIYVMIRPRGGDFVYAAAEFEQMKQQLLRFKLAGANGFVFGCLQENGKVHDIQNKELVQLAHPFPCTFHRAFDEIQNKEQGLLSIADCGFKTILTAGHSGNASDGIPVLKKLQAQAKDKILLMPGGGIRSTVAAQICRKTQVTWLHSSAITSGKEADPKEIKAILAAVQKA